MSLVDQFLEENDDLDQYTKSNDDETQMSQQQRKQMLQDFKKKYNFYNDSSSESEEEQQIDDNDQSQDGGDHTKSVQLENDKSEHDINENDSQQDLEQDKGNNQREEEEEQKKETKVRKNKYSFSSSEDDYQEDFRKKQCSPITKKQESSDESEEEEQQKSIKQLSKYNNYVEQQDNSDEEQSNCQTDRSANDILKPSILKEAQYQERVPAAKNGREEENKNDESDLDFYQLSDIDTSNLLNSSVKKPKRGGSQESFEDEENDYPQLKSSIAKVASLLDNQIQAYDKLAQSAGSDKLLQSINQKPLTSKPQTEMTFGDLTDDQDKLDYPKFIPTNSNLQPTVRSQKPIHQSIIKEETQEDDCNSSLSHSLNYSSLATSMQYNGQQSLNSQIIIGSRLHQKQQQIFNYQAQQQEEQENTNSSVNKSFIIKMLIIKKSKIQQQAAFNKLKENQIKEFYGFKLKNAAQMVDKMSKFSRSFISLNSLSQIILKNKQRVQAKYYIKWALQTFREQSSQKQKPQISQSISDNKLVTQLRQEIQEKDSEISKMEQMFREYQTWKSKLEQIELKMKSEVDYWKSAADRLQKENEKLQKEAMRISQQLMERTKEIESKEVTMESLQKKLRQAQEKAKQQVLDPVEEAVCQNCKNSLEESQMMSGRLSTARRDSQSPNKDLEQQYAVMIHDLTDKLSNLERQLLTYRERVHYHESIEDELKKNIESQVDVVLKMEEERLLMMRECKESKDKNKALVFENEEYKSKISLFEKELEELQVQVKEQSLIHQQNQSIQDDITDSETQSVMSKQSTNKENKQTLNIKKKPTLQGATKPKVKKPTGVLKFQNSSTNKMVGENSAVFSASLKQAIITQEQDTKSKYGQEPINKSLISDNTLLTNEVVTMGREINKLKTELRQAQETLKKSEKEKYDTKKNLEGKENALDKLRKERDELWAIVSTDKYRSIKQMDSEKNAILLQKQEQDQQIQQLTSQVKELQSEFEKREQRVKECESEVNRMKDKDNQREALMGKMEVQISKYEREINMQEQLNNTLKQENDLVKQENQKLKKDVDWLANSAKNNKLQAERAISDLESYTKILRGMEKKLAEVEVEKEAKEVEMRDIRNKMLQQQQQYSINAQPQFNQNIMGQQIQHNNGINMQQQQQWQNSQMQTQNQQQQQQYMSSQQQQMWGQQYSQMAQRQGVPQPHQPPQRF